MGQSIYKNLIKFVFIFSGLLFFLFLPSSHIKAEELSPAIINDHLLISQVYYYCNSGEPTESEWIELYNPTDNAIDLSNYKIGDAANKGDNEGMFWLPNDYFLESEDSIIIRTRKSGVEYDLEFCLIKNLSSCVVSVTGKNFLKNFTTGFLSGLISAFLFNNIFIPVMTRNPPKI